MYQVFWKETLDIFISSLCRQCRVVSYEHWYILYRCQSTTFCLLVSGVHMLGLLVPILVSLLSDSTSLPKGSRITKNLHEQALQKLMKIGPKYPEPFRTVIGSSPDLKSQLEGAVRANQASAKQKQPAAQPKVAPTQPSIKLRMDFSNYK